MLRFSRYFRQRDYGVWHLPSRYSGWPSKRVKDGGNGLDYAVSGRIWTWRSKLRLHVGPLDKPAKSSAPGSRSCSQNFACRRSFDSTSAPRAAAYHRPRVYKRRKSTHTCGSRFSTGSFVAIFIAHPHHIHSQAWPHAAKPRNLLLRRKRSAPIPSGLHRREESALPVERNPHHLLQSHLRVVQLLLPSRSSPRWRICKYSRSDPFRCIGKPPCHY